MTLFDIKYDDFKREDTTNVIAITLYTDDKQPITPNASHTWKAKVSKGDEYVGEYPVIISGNTIKLSSSNLTRLPNGDYGLELWETYSGSTTIYPSAGVMEFRVHRNANDTLGTVDPTTDINAIIEDLHKAGQNVKVVATNTLPAGSKASVTQAINNGENQLTFNIPQGIQGEQGNVGPAPTLKIGTVTKLNPDQAPTADLTGDNGAYTLNMGIPQGVQGETNKTATNALNLANSVNDKVTKIQSNGGGRNLLLGTRDFSGNSWTADVINSWKKTDETYNGLSVIETAGNWNGAAQFYRVKQGETYTFSLFARYTSGTGKSSIFISLTSEHESQYQRAELDNDETDCYLDATWKKYSITFTVKTDGYIRPRMERTNDNANALRECGLMLEKGTVAHDWSPAPEDIQSEIDALKQAVKELEGTI